VSENSKQATQWADNTQWLRRAAKQIAATYSHRAIFMYIYGGHNVERHHVAASQLRIQPAEFVLSLVDTATAPGNADWSHAALSNKPATYVVPFTSLPDFNMHSKKLFAAQPGQVCQLLMYT